MRYHGAHHPGACLTAAPGFFYFLKLLTFLLKWHIIKMLFRQMHYHGVHQPASTERGRGLFLFFEVVMPLLHFSFMRFSMCPRLTPHP